MPTALLAVALVPSASGQQRGGIAVDKPSGRRGEARHRSAVDLGLAGVRVDGERRRGDRKSRRRGGHRQDVVGSRDQGTQREGVGADGAARRGHRAECSGQHRGGIAVDKPGGRRGEARHGRAVDLGLTGVRLDREQRRSDRKRWRGGHDQRVVRTRAKGTHREGISADAAARRGHGAECSGQERGGIAVDESGGRRGEARHRRAVDLGLAGVRLNGERRRGDRESRRRGGQRQGVVRSRVERTEREGVGADRAARRGHRAERSGQQRGGIAVDEPGGRLGEARHRRAVDLGLAAVRLDGERRRGDRKSWRRGG